MAVPGTRRSQSNVDLAARLLTLICLLNLNDVMYMMFDLQQALSLLMLVTSLFLIFMRGRLAISHSSTLMMLSLVSYIMIGTMYSDGFIEIDYGLRYQLMYVSTILIIWAMAGYVAGLPTGFEFDRFTGFVRNVLLAAAVSVWTTPFLATLYVNAPVDTGERAGGFFGNANEAAYASLLAYVITFARPFPYRSIQYLALTVAAGAVVMTFSKAGLSMLIVVTAAIAARRMQGIALLALPFVAALLLLAVQNVDGLVTGLVEQQYFELSDNQKYRILQVQQILGGELSDDTSTGRTFLWALTIERAWDKFPLGSGLGSFHHIIGGILENGVWQGSHNTLLMIWGESGALPFVLLLAALASLISATFRIGESHLRFYTMLTIGILIASMMSGHSALGVRFLNIMQGFVFGVLAAAGAGRLIVGTTASLADVTRRNTLRPHPSRHM